MKYRYPVSVSCGVLEVSASGYFNWLRRRESGHGGPARRHSDEALLAYMRAIHAEVKGEYGWPRMHKELLARGIRVGKDRVRKLMQQHGIRAKTKRKFVVTTDSRHSLPVAPDLVQRRFNPEAPNQLWSGDITYRRLLCPKVGRWPVCQLSMREPPASTLALAFKSWPYHRS